MVVRLHNVTKWKCLKPGEMLSLRGSQPRRVRVEVNCVAPTRFDIVAPNGVPVFLAVVQGLETLEFSAGADTNLVPTSEDEVWFFTNDGDHTASPTRSASFTKLATRRERNPQLELMMFKQEQNMRRREARMAAEIAEMRAAMAANAGADPATGEISDHGDGKGATGGDRSAAAGVEPGVADPAKPGADDGAGA